mmetsp:Transcript_102736/g.165508  ORF Transcript_102736/g.165508 Transcript_102736/m.165508 type:complete len:306 (+) Transcript_102736:40-957(+)|eukprot:CAMPEP_0179432936 /NCGR_PEP_ID=MMETSP0799-20121207/17427_1 /TAXON_ID=46947 /ORGANISM="Geminigera cryophila, Strain CCMP2564" /LENGTH=305 /DNA_ID=CAMNT_0021210567 /DNA_START=14 /DNA_END=931 /DNA_ORIENTATION=-
MAGQLSEYAYGKIKIRVMKVNRESSGRHDVHELTVKTLLFGDFADAWTTGSNHKIIATETQKNTVYQLARTTNCSSPEEFGKIVAAHFINTYPWVKKAQITLWEDPWARIEVNGTQHNHCFTKDTTERRYAEVVHERGQPAQVSGGIFNLIVLKTTNSSFEGFVGTKGSYQENDKWCTLGETKERLFSTAIESTWKFATPNADFNKCYADVKSAFLETFAGDPVKGVPSPSAQQTQHDMCKVALARCAPFIQEIKITTPNLHYMPLSSAVVPSHMHADNKDVFFPIDGPSGFVESTATLAPRSKM